MRILCFALLLLSGGISSAFAQEMRNLSILTGSPTGTYYRFGQDIAKVVKDECDADLKVKASEGSLANIQRLRHEDSAQLAIVQQDTLEYLKEAAQQDDKLKDILTKIRYVFPLYPEEIHLVTTKSSGITELSDIAGKRVAVGSLESGTYLTTTFLLLLSHVTVAPVEINEIEALPRLLLPEGSPGKIDAFFYVAGKPVGLLTKEPRANLLTLVNIRDPAVQQRYAATKITPADYPWLPHSIDTVKVISVLMSFDFRHENCLNIGMVANRIRVNLEELQEKTGHPKWRQVDLDASLPGWERYDCVTKYLHAVVGAVSGRRCVFLGDGPARDRVGDTPSPSPQCTGQASDNPIVRSLCNYLHKLPQ
jgi:uncharacterized protein